MPNSFRHNALLSVALEVTLLCLYHQRKRVGLRLIQSGNYVHEDIEYEVNYRDDGKRSPLTTDILGKFINELLAMRPNIVVYAQSDSIYTYPMEYLYQKKTIDKQAIHEA
jgi:hypothetical protein